MDDSQNEFSSSAHEFSQHEEPQDRSFLARVTSSAALYIKTTWSEFYGGCLVIGDYLFAECRRSPSTLVLSMSLVALLVFVVSLLDSSVSQSPVIFMKIAENSVGENDLILTAGLGVANRITAYPTAFGGLPILNESYIDQALSTSDHQPAAPRFLMLGQVLATDTAAVGATGHPSNAILLGLWQLRESLISLGRSWPFPPLAPYHCILSSSIVREIGLVRTNAEAKNNNDGRIIGSPITFRIDIPSLYSQLTAGDEADTLVSDAAAERAAAENAQQTGSSSGSSSSAQSQLAFERFLLTSLYPSAAQRWNQTIDTRAFLAALSNRSPSSLPQTLNITTILQILGLTNNANLTALAAILDSFLPAYSDLFNNFNATAVAIRINTAFHTNFNASQIQTIRDDIVAQMSMPIPSGGNNNNNNNNYLLQVIRALYRLSANMLTYGDAISLLSPFLSTLLTIDVPLTIAGVVDEPDGKWSNQIGSVVVIENAAIQSIAQSALHQLVYFNRTYIDLGQLTLFGYNFGDLRLPLPAGLINADAAAAAASDAGTAILDLCDTQNLVSCAWPARVLAYFGANSTVVTRVNNAFVQLQQSVAAFEPNRYALMSVVQYFDRVKAYMSSLLGLKWQMAHFTNYVSDAVGIAFPVTYSLPIALVLEQMIYIRYFLDNIFGSVLVMIIGLGSLLVFSLLLSDVKGKTYEYGMLRALGMPSSLLIQLLTSKATFFAVPAVGIGLFVSWICFIPVAIAVGRFSSLPPVYALDTTAIIAATVIGLVMPIVASIIPIRRALSSTLRDSLDLFHQVTSDLTIRVQRLADLGFDLWQTSTAILLIAFGFVTFYLVPYAFTFQNIPMLMAILNSILLAMLLGLCIVASTLQPMLEFGMLWILARYRRHSLYPIVRKNLGSHRPRNANTASMFTVALAFLIFAAAMFDLQSHELADNIRLFNGADVTVIAPPRSPRYALREADMTNFLNTQLVAKGGPVQNFTFVTFALNYMRPMRGAWISNLPQQPVYRAYVYGIAPNYLDVAYNEFLIIGEQALITDDVAPRAGVTADTDVIAQLTLDAGNRKLPVEQEVDGKVRIPHTVSTAGPSIEYGRASLGNISATEDQTIVKSYVNYLDVIVTYALHDAASVTINTPLDLHLSARPPNTDPDVWTGDADVQIHYLSKARAMLRKCPGFLFSSFRQTASIGPVFVSQRAFDRLLRDVYGPNAPPAPKSKLLIRFREGATDDDRMDVINGLRTFIENRQTFVVDTITILNQMNAAIDLLQLFFLVVGLLAMLMCAVMLWLSFKGNVEEAEWELAVLRSLGLTKVEIVLVFVYESASLVLSSVILGSVIGLIIAASLTAQFIAFIEMPFRMVFPYTLFFTMLGMSMFVAGFASYLPTRSLLKASIAHVLRRA